MGIALEDTVHEDLAEAAMQSVCAPLLQHLEPAFRGVEGEEMTTEHSVTNASNVRNFLQALSLGFQPTSSGLRVFVELGTKYIKYKLLQLMSRRLLILIPSLSERKLSKVLTRTAHQILLNGKIRTCPIKEMSCGDILDLCKPLITANATEPICPVMLPQPTNHFYIAEAANLTAFSLMFEKQSVFDEQACLIGAAAVIFDDVSHADTARELFKHVRNN